jgi:hypothetical protein
VRIADDHYAGATWPPRLPPAGASSGRWSGTGRSRPTAERSTPCCTARSSPLPMTSDRHSHPGARTGYRHCSTAPVPTRRPSRSSPR